jgi:hypothetical protein
MDAGGGSAPLQRTVLRTRGGLTDERLVFKISAHVAARALRGNQNFYGALARIATARDIVFSTLKKGGFYDPQSESGLARDGP